MRKLKIGLLAATCSACALFTNPVLSTELTASIWFPDTHPLTRDGYQELAQTISSETNGDLTLKVYTGTSILPATAHLSGLVDGIVDMTYHAGTYTPSDLPEDNVLSVLSPNFHDSVTAVMAVADFYINNPEMQSRFDDHGIVFLGAYASPQYQMICTKEVASIEQMKGTKMRMASPSLSPWLRTIGASSVNVPSSEMYTGLEKGQIDCAVITITDLKSRSLWDVAKHATLLPFGPYFAGWQYAINENAWHDLDKASRQILLNAISDNTIDMTLAYLETDDQAKQEAAEHGVKVVEPSENLKDSLQEFIDNNLSNIALETGEKLKVKNVDELVESFMDTYNKWEELLDGVDREDPDALKSVLYDNLYSQIDVDTYAVK